MTFCDPAALVHEAVQQHLSVPLAMRCSEWADRYRIIVKGPERGQWRTSRTPYLAEPMDCTDPDHPAQKVVLQFATQMGKSEVLYSSIFKRIHISPMDMMFVQPTLQDAKDHSTQRFSQTAKAMPHVIARIAETRSRDETNTIFTKEIAEGSATLFFSGANSARSLASKPLGFAACDEVDGYPLDVDGEGDPLGLISERMSNFPGRKLLMCSTPTTRDFSTIEREYLASDRRLYWVPCPHCGEYQVLEWGLESGHGIKWLKTEAGIARPETAVYICRHCAAAIKDHQKTKMLAEGQWRADAPGAQNGTVAGFRISKIYSPVGWKSWEMLVREWLLAVEASRGGEKSQLKRFFNTSLAETWEEQGDRADTHALQARAKHSSIKLGVVGPGLYVCTMGVDVQGDRLEAYIWAWGRGMERQLVDRRVIYGDPARVESEPGSPWADLTAYRRALVPHVSGASLAMLAVFIDSGGHHTHEVYLYARAHKPERVFAVKGSSRPGKDILAGASNVEIDWKGQRIKRGVRLWSISTDVAKAEIYGRLRVETPGPGFVHLSPDLPAEVFEQLTAERLVTRYIKGHPKLEWVKPIGRRNEALDCAVYALAAAHFLQIDRWREADWAQWQAKAEPTPKSEPAAKAAAGGRRMRGSIGLRPR